MLDTIEKAKIAWHCRRGMLELDILLQRFFAHQLEHLSAEEIKMFHSLLNCADPELYNWLMDYDDPEDEELKKIVTIIRNNN